jgi:competence protein ComGC
LNRERLWNMALVIFVIIVILLILTIPQIVMHNMQRNVNQIQIEKIDSSSSWNNQGNE